MYNTRVRFACPIYFSRDQSSSKLIIFLDSKLERSNSRVAKIDSRLDSRNFRGSRIESRVEFHNSRVTVNLPLSDRAQKPLHMRTRIALVLPPFDFQNGGRQIKIQHVIVDAVAPLSFL